MNANELRRTFTGFFVERGHKAVPSSGLIPHHPRAPLFTNAGMNQFLPIVLGEEVPSHPRATSVQKCVRVRGKHDDIDNIGRTTRHLTFFEMLGNFSFGDYFKEQAIPLAWELLTERLGLEGERLWASVYLDDDEAAAIWADAVGLPAERIQRMGEDNFWEMGDVGPCGPCSEIYYDRGPAYGEAGGPAHGGAERYVEIWNLVFMQYDRQPDGSLAPLPRRIIDTGMGLERTLTVVQDVPSVFETDVLRPLVETAEQITGFRYGGTWPGSENDVSLRILADHARSMTFLTNDGVFPSNEDRGYVLRRIIRRAVRQAYRLGVEKPVTPALVAATVSVMGEAYPELVRNQDFVTHVLLREEERFRQTLRSGLSILEEEIAGGARTVPGETAFRLHDTFGFPIEITTEIAAERGVEVDSAGFEQAMEAQRARARAGGRDAGAASANAEAYRELLEQFGSTEFTGYQEVETAGVHVLAVLPDPAGADRLEVFVDRTPFYAEGGGQVGDTGEIVTETGRARVLDATSALPGLSRHTAEVVEGELYAGQEATARIDVERREAIRRNHTGTHMLHWALRAVLGAHVKQQGSLVAPDYLRFDFSHFGPMTAEEIDRVERMVNEHIVANEPVRAFETTREHAEQLGAIAMFGEKYGEFVRVVEAGNESLELCGGTHVHALGSIGPLKITQESSIGSNTRRIFALTGLTSLEHLRDEERALQQAAELLRAQPAEVPDAVERVLRRQRELADELKAIRSRGLAEEARRLANAAEDGTVVARVDELTPEQLRELALSVRQQPGVRAAVLLGSPDGQRVSLVAAVAKDSGLVASDLIADAARAVGGGTGRNPELAVAGGRDASRIDDALALVRARLG
jgi:alanyl-tRNA synthetase